MSDELIDDHIDHLKSGPTSDRTIESRLSVLRQLHNRLPFGLAYAATEQIEAWLSRLRENGRAQATLAVYGYHVKAFYLWACNAGFLDGDPAATIALATAPQCIPNPVTEDELAQVLTLPEPFRTVAILAAFEGLRVSEIGASRREHLTPETLMVPVGKGGQPDVVPTHPFVWAELADRPPGPFVVDQWGQPVSGHWISVHARKKLDKIGLYDVHMHRLRHRYGTLIQDMQGDIRVTQVCLRHRRVTSTEGYTKVSDAKRVVAVAALPVPGAAPAGH